MINTPTPYLEINWMDEHAIRELYRATLVAERNYRGLVIVDAKGLYERSYVFSSIITRLTLERIMRNARQK